MNFDNPTFRGCKGFIEFPNNGTSTNIWRDRWLPGGVGMKPLWRKDEVVAEQVSKLLSPDGRSWDEDALNLNLIPLDAAAARQIPLVRQWEDFWECHGNYTVKSGYRLLATAEARKEIFKRRRRQIQTTQVTHYGKSYGNAMFHLKSVYFGGDYCMIIYRVEPISTGGTLIL
jgi:hypothetical protein